MVVRCDARCDVDLEIMNICEYWQYLIGPFMVATKAVYDSSNDGRCYLLQEALLETFSLW